MILAGSLRCEGESDWRLQRIVVEGGKAAMLKSSGNLPGVIGILYRGIERNARVDGNKAGFLAERRMCGIRNADRLCVWDQVEK